MTCISFYLLNPSSHFEYLYHERNAVASPGVRTNPIVRKAYTMTDYPTDLAKKVTLIKHFKGYMQSNGSGDKAKETGRISDLDFLTKYIKSKHGVVFRLSNHNVQVRVLSYQL